MKFIIDEPGPQHRHVRGEIRVGPAHPGLGRAGCAGVEVHDLTHGVNPGVGASGAHHSYRRRRNPCQRLLDLALDRASIGLALETVKTAAVVFETERDAHSYAADSWSASVEPVPDSWTRGRGLADDHRESGKLREHIPGGVSLIGIAFGQHRLEESTSAFGVAHFHVHLGKIDLRLRLVFAEIVE